MPDKPIFYYATGTAFTPNYFLENGSIAVEYFPIGASDTIFYVPGIDGKIAPFSGGITNDPFPVLVAGDLWDAVKVPYLASAFPMDQSISGGVEWIVNEVQTKLPKGAPWAIGGQSQGAAVCSYIYNEVRYGRLTDWASGFLTGICFGNPMRQVNYTNPWSSYSGAFDVPGSTTGGHGSFPASYRLTNCNQNNWIEFTNPDEIITGVGDSPLGQWWQAANGAFLLQTILTPGSPGSFLFNAFQFLVGIDGGSTLLSLAFNQFFPQFAQFNSIPSFFDQLNAVTTSTHPDYDGPGPMTDAKGQSIQLDGGGHAIYAGVPPYGYSGTETSYQLALKHLNSVALEFATSPSVLPPSTSTAGWSTTLFPPAA